MGAGGCARRGCGPSRSNASIVMSEKPSAVYSCPSCGALSQIDAAAGDEGVCRECGHQFKRPVQVGPRNVAPRGIGAGRFVQRDVALKRRHPERASAVLPPERQVADPPDASEATPIEATAGGDSGDADWDDDVVSDDGHKRVVRRRKKRLKAAPTRRNTLVVLWIVGVIGVTIFIGVKLEFIGVKLKYRKDQDVVLVPAEQAAREEAAREEAARETTRGEMRAYINEHIGECRKVLTEFWKAPSGEIRAQFVCRSQRVTPLMARYSKQHSERKPAGLVAATGSNLIVGDEFRAIETHWKDEDGVRYEVVFVKEEGEWKIDWEAYVRYCSANWDVFVSGALDEAAGEFRVLMKEVQVPTKEHIGVKFYPAGYDSKNRRKGVSPTVLVRVDSPLGRKVRAVLEGLDRQVVLGEAAAWKEDPQMMARVRVLLEWRRVSEWRRDSKDRHKVMYLNELVAGSWLAEELAEPILPAGADDTAGTDDSEGDG